MSEPLASLPHMPGYDEMTAAAGGRLLPWPWARARLEVSHNYWLTSVRPDGRPHTMPVWGIWRDDAFAFSTGSGSRKARNLRENPQVTVATEDAASAVVVEGRCEVMADVAVEAFIAAYARKYEWTLTADMAPFYVVRPRVAFGIPEDGGEAGGAMTRWTFT